jgi:hypothetical protein
MKTKKLLKIFETVSFFLAAYPFKLLLEILISDVSSSFKGIARLWAYALALLAVALLPFIFHLLGHAKSPKSYALTAKYGGIAVDALAFLSIAGITLGVSKGLFSTFVVSGGPTYLYPLDGYILSWVLLALGTGLYIHGAKAAQKAPEMVYYVEPDDPRWLRVLAAIFKPLFLLVALYFQGCLYLTPFILDGSFSHFGGFLGFILWMMVPIALYLTYLYGYLDLDNPDKKKLRLYRLSVIYCGLGFFFFLWFVIAYFLDPYFLVEKAAPLLTADFMYSLNLGPILLFLTTLLTPALGFLLFIRGTGKKKHPGTEKEARE